jgi:hypothetical protein
MYGFNYVNCGLLGCDAMQCCGWLPTYQRNIPPPSSRQKYPENGSDMFLQNAGNYLYDYTA